MRKLLTALVAFFALSCCAEVSRAEGGRTVVILDATAQMAATLGQKRKLDLAKSHVSAAASRIDSADSLALWAFGTVPQRKCEDIRELVPLQPVSAASRALDKALSALQPKAARSPAMDAVKAAIKAAAADGKTVSAVLIVGTGDDCTGDICSAAGKLHGLYPNAKLTVVGMTMSEQAAANYSCAAKAMGGAFTAVKSGADLERSLRQALGVTQTSGPPQVAVVAAPNAASESAEAGPPAKPAEAAAGAPSPRDQPPQKETEEKLALPPQPEPNVVLSATLVSGMPPLEAGVTWEIYKTQVTPTGQIRPAEAPLWVGGGGQALAKLPEGRYSARATYGLANGAGEFSVAADKVEKTIALDAGTIAVEALQTPRGPAASDAFFVLSKQKTSAAREELSRSSGSPALFHLNSGDYVLNAFAGLARLETPVKVTAGKVSVVRMAMNVGTLEIKTFARQGSQDLLAAWHRISQVGSGSNKGDVSSLRVSGSSHRLQLPAGTYRVQSVYGNATEENTVAIAAGQTTPLDVVLNAGEAKLSLASGKPDKVCAVYEAGGDRKAEPLGRAAGGEIRFILKAGRYDVECRKKGEGAPAKQMEITVVAGEVHSAKIEE